ncbi:efflux RND transporter periplasmic adaptor subunit (plasmid) [Cetobacterium somerae]|uniref:efflux RND transporter periplasmic adaptor subunit n=1 Tax=Cetobacterium somerae TaxID=188913 RepID=UPI003D767568
MKNKIICISFVVISLLLGGYLVGGKENKKEVKVSKVELGNLSSSVIYTGVVIPGEVIPIYIEAPALIETVLAKEGQEVNPGDKLMIFSTKSIIENDKELRINELDLKNIKLKIADLEGGSLKLELDNRKLEIRSLQEKIKGDERKLPVLTSETRVLKEKSEIYKKLLIEDGVSSIDSNRAITEAENKFVELEELKTNLELNRQKLELSAVSLESLTRQLIIEEANLKANLEKLQLENESLIRRAEQLKKPLESPIEGVITTVDVSEGSNVFSGQRLLAISPKGEGMIKVEIPMYVADSILRGQKTLIRTSTSQGEQLYTGTVERVSNIVRESGLSGKKDKIVEVEVKISEKNTLKPGFLTDVEISTESIRKTAIIPSFSVMEERGKSFVYVVKEGKAHKVEVEIGARTSTDYEVLNLPLGSQVIVNPFKVSNGDKVEIVI